MNVFARFFRLRPALALLSVILALSAAFVSAEELSPIFNGKDLTGWKAVGGAVFEVKDGVILGKTGDGTFGWLCTEKTYGDFILELEVKITSGNSGIQIRRDRKSTRLNSSHEW